MSMSIDGGVPRSINPEYSVSCVDRFSRPVIDQLHAAMNHVLTPVLDVHGLTTLTGS